MAPPKSGVTQAITDVSVSKIVESMCNSISTKRIKIYTSILPDRVTIEPPSDDGTEETALVADETKFAVVNLRAEAEGELLGEGAGGLDNVPVGVVDVFGGNGAGEMENATLWTVLRIL